MEMRNLSLALAVGVLLVCADVARADGAENLAAGTGTIAGFGEPMVHVNAQSEQGGASPRGHFWIRYPNGAEFGGRVECLTVVGNSAGLTGRIEKVKVSGPNFVVGNYVQIRLTDNGSPGTADLVNLDPGTPQQPTGCAPTGDLRTQQGNYVVHNSFVDLSVMNALLMDFEAQAGDPYGMHG